ncbi:MAG: dockerin type I repeat-containing protein, partial [Oscillospiraceae bacterium]|nr:dockerin type I repeat-containing protein [Oscillospiraceae bacterium]
GVCTMKLLPKTDEFPELVPGDVNLDFVLDTKDLLIVQDWLLGIGSLPVWQNADLDQDGKITIFDLTAMKQLLLSES